MTGMWKPTDYEGESFRQRDYAATRPKRSAKSSRMKSGCASASQRKEITWIREAANGWTRTPCAQEGLVRDDLGPETGCAAG